MRGGGARVEEGDFVAETGVAEVVGLAVDSGGDVLVGEAQDRIPVISPRRSAFPIHFDFQACN